jgi:D-lactate dehydrogenase (cytochrome)
MPDANVSAAIDELAALLGPDRVITGSDERRRHGSDESWHPPAPPDAVVRIRSTEEAVAVVRACARHGAPIVPFGAGTSLEGHVAALRGGISVDTTEMDAVLRLSVADMDVTVQAGVTRRALDDKLRPEGVFFSVDPGADATIGGMIATGASGTTSVRYGTMRENVLSLEVVTAGGDVVRTGSRARKSSAGYDLTRLFVGSEGTLGLITAATLRLHPTPEAMSAAVCAFERLEDAVNCVIAVLQHAIPVARIELLDALQMDAVNRHADLDYAVAPTLFLEFHGGSAREVGEQADEVGALAQEYGSRGFAWAADESERRRLWRARHRAYEAARALRPGARGFATDACVPVSNLAECILETHRDIEASGLIAPIVGHVGDGNFHLAILVDPDDEDELARAVALNERLVRRAIALDGTCTGEHGVGYGKSAFLELEHGPEGVALMRAIKAALDPQGIFNPGKVAQANLGSTSRA